MTLLETGWQIYEPGDLTQWDGLTNWFMHMVEQDVSLQPQPSIADTTHALDASTYNRTHK